MGIIKIFEESDSIRWNEIVDSAPGGTIFHRWQWLKIAEKHFKSRLYPLVYLDDGGKPFGVFPLFYSRRGPLKMVFSPPPGCSMRLGPILIGSQLKQHKLEYLYNNFQAQVDSFIKELGANYVLISSSPGLNDIRPFIWSNYDVTPAYTYRIDLTQGEEGVWGNFKSELRNDIRRTEKRGVSVVERVSDTDIEYAYESVSRRYKAQKMRTGISKQYLYDLFQQFGSSNLRLFVALYEDRVLGAIINTAYKDTVSAWVGAVKSDISGLAVNDLIYWEVIKWAIGNGYKEYEIIGADTPRLCEFKSKYSPHLEICFNIKKTGLLGNMAEKAYLELYKRKQL